MSLNLITGYAGKAHITSAGDGAVNAAIYGGGRYVLNAGECFGYELLSNNQIRIKSGYAMNQGRKIELAVSDYEDIEIDNGLQGVKRCDLIVISYEKNVASGIETATMKVIKGTSGDDYTDPEYTSGDILSGAILDDFPLYRVKINGLNVEAVEKLFEVRKGIAEDDLKNNVSTFDSTDASDADANTWTNVEKLHSGETMKSIFGKIAAMFKNIRYLYKAHDYDRNTKITEYYYSNTEDKIADTLTGNVINKIYSKDKGKSPYSTTKEFLAALMGSMAAFYQYFVGYVNPQLNNAITTSNIGIQSVKYAESAGAVTWGKVSGKPTFGTAASKNISPNTGNPFETIPYIKQDGAMEVGKYIDFHENASTQDYDVRVEARTDGLTLGGTTKGSFEGTLNGTASSATNDSGGYHIHNTFNQIIQEINNKIQASKYGANHVSTITGGWSTVEEDGVQYVSYYTGCCVFTSDTTCDIHIDILLRDNFGVENGKTFHTHCFEMKYLKDTLGMSNLIFSPEQTEVLMFPGDYLKSGSLENIIFDAQVSGNKFSHLRMTSDGRITRQYYDGNTGITYGNIQVNRDHYIMKQGNIFRVDIFGAIYN